MTRISPLLRLFAVFLAASLLLAGCQLPQFGGQVTITLTADSQTRDVQVAAGSTVLQALQQAGITPGDLDRVEPPFYAVLGNGDQVKLVRVKEEFQTEIQVLPYERQTIRNETLTEGETRLVQAGEQPVERFRPPLGLGHFLHCNRSRIRGLDRLLGEARDG